MPFCVFEFFSKYMCSVALCALGKEQKIFQSKVMMNESKISQGNDE